MTGPSIINKIALRFLQYFIASVLLLTGIGKLLDVPGFVEALTTYQILPTWGLHFVAVVLVLLELRISEWLFRDKTLILGALGSVILHTVFSIFAMITLWRGVSVPNCGCFGVFFARPLTGVTVVEDLVMVLASFLLLRLAVRQKQFFLV